MAARRAKRIPERTDETHAKSVINERDTGSRTFSIGQHILSLAHGEGKIIAVERQEIDGQSVDLLVISFGEVTLRVPTARAASYGIRVLFEPVTSPAESAVPAPRAQPTFLDELQQHGYSEDELFELVIPRRTLARRRAEGDLLTVEETDKAMRLLRIAAQGERVFGAADKAHRWLRKPKRELSNQTPLTFLKSEAGARVVEEMLFRIDHGMTA